MTQINVERIKLFSTRSPYWCLALIPVFGIGFTVLISLVDQGSAASLESSQAWAGFAISIVMVMSALAITTEYRFGTIRSSFLAVPKRGRVLAAKAVLLAVVSLVTVEITSLIAFNLMKAIRGPQSSAADFVLNSSGDYRVLWGPGVVCAMAAVLALGVGALVRQSAGAIAILLLWPLLVENLFQLFGKFGRTVYPWLPFNAGNRVFAGAEADARQTARLNGSETVSVPNWWEGGLVFLGVTMLIYLAALVAINRRDA